MTRVSEGAGVLNAGDWLVSPFLDRLVYRVAYQRGIAMTADLPDLMQEIRIAIWEEGTETRMTAALVMRIATNKAIDLIRGLDRRRVREGVAARAATTHRENGELQHLLNVRVSALPTRLRKFYKLHYELGFSERATARVLGLSRASVRWLDHRCRLLVIGNGPTRHLQNHPNPWLTRSAPRSPN